MEAIATSIGLVPAVLSGFGGSVLAAPLLRRVGLKRSALLALVPAALTAYFASLVPQISAGKVLVARLGWLDELGLALSLRLDGLSLLFALLITGVGTLVTVYAGPYLAHDRGAERFFVFLLAFMASMLGLVLSANLLVLYVFWELTSVTSYFLIAFHHEKEEAREAALQALLVTSLGGLALLAGLVLLAIAGGSFEWELLVGRAAQIKAHPLYLPALLLLCAGCFTKSAQVPFHFWLPRAMEAPTPASAYLHAATMVKAGVFLLMRLLPVLGGTAAWSVLLTTFGGLTLIHGALVAVGQDHLKRLLAYATVSALGMLVFLIGIGTEAAVFAALVYLFAHALYKGALFLAVGSLGHELRTLELTEMSGLRRTMPATAATALLAALSLAGLPPLLGFVAKEAVYEATSSTWLLVFPLLGSLLLVTAAGLVAVRPFFGSPSPFPRASRDAPWSMVVPAALLAVAGLGAGLWLPATRPLLAPALRSVRPAAGTVSLSLWHGLTFELLLSVLTVAGGAGLYLVREPVCGAARRLYERLPLSASRAWDLGFAGLLRASRRTVDVLQSGYLRRYLLLYVVVTIAGIAAVLGTSWPELTGAPLRVRPYEAGVAVAILLGTAATALATGRLAAVAAMGATGFGVALLFVLFGAPDLAMTQFVVESLTVVVFVLAFRRLPRFTELSPLLVRLRDGAVALVLGGVMTLLVRAASPSPAVPPVSGWFLENSVSAGKGHNVVNVILTDFRALDTLGEITVLAVATFGIVALVRLGRGKGAAP